MWIIGAGIALGGLVAGSFTSLGMVAVCELIGWTLIGLAKLRDEEKERQSAQRWTMYPTYKY